MQAISQVQTTHFRPWLSIWFHPRRTIQEIVNTKPMRWVIPLILLSGLFGGITNWGYAVEMDTDNFQENLLLSVGTNLVMKTATVFLACLALHWISVWNGNEVQYSHLLSATAWGDFPSVIALLLLFLATVGEVLVLLFYPSGAEFVSLASLLVMSIGIVVLAIWSAVLQLGTLSQVMHCSVGAVIGRTIGAGLICLIPIIAMSSLLGYFCNRLFTDTDIVIYQRSGAEEENLLLSVGLPVAVLILSATGFFIINRITHTRKAAAPSTDMENNQDDKSQETERIE